MSLRFWVWRERSTKNQAPKIQKSAFVGECLLSENQVLPMTAHEKKITEQSSLQIL